MVNSVWRVDGLMSCTNSWGNLAIVCPRVGKRGGGTRNGGGKGGGWGKGGRGKRGRDGGEQGGGRKKIPNRDIQDIQTH